MTETQKGALVNCKRGVGVGSEMRKTLKLHKGMQ